jgi:ATP-dependent DNA helicase PIF1
MMNNIIEASILNGKFKGEDVLLPRIPMIPTDMSFEFKRLHFPLRLAFAMTINKAQGHRYKCVDYFVCLFVLYAFINH